MNDAVRKTWGQRLKTVRHEAGLRQDDLAAIAGISQGFLSELERGIVGPSDEMKGRLAAALNVPIGDLFPWPEQAA